MQLSAAGYSAIELVTGFPPSIGFMGELPKLTEREASDAQKLRGIPSEGMGPPISRPYNLCFELGRCALNTPTNPCVALGAVVPTGGAAASV